MANIYQSIQGNMGLGKAIEYFTSWGIPVALPLNDTQKYDLIADFDGKLQRVSVKTSRFSVHPNTFDVLLKNCGGGSKGATIRHFDNTTCDYVFIYTADNNIYLIPSTVITAKNSITVGNKYVEYRKTIRTLADFKNEIE